MDGRAGCLRHADGWGWYVYPCRDRTPGLYVRLADRWIVGGYENSIGRTSVYAGRTWTMVEVLDGRVALDVALGAVTGYDRASVEPMVAASVRVALGERVALRLLPIPRIPRRTETAAVHVAVEVRL
ncbi:hypothetical protein [Vulcaniibacterium gelatinicum]|uniref:hypothetical protein n=1 Tax=Vulcaniibacterium gelatinicum TaxID=2598725 RepID=UPI0011C7C50E|nr:hypothetical protein [Vulcaniibacterium gelatinicum]